MTNNFYKILTITGVKEEVNNVKLFYLEEQGEKIHYHAGQYLTFILPEGETELRRSYSLASSPDLNEPLCIGIKRIDNGSFSRKLVDLARSGDQLISLGAAGQFVLPKDLSVSRQVVFFAAGSGIVPIYSLLKTVLHKQPHIRSYLVYSNSSIETTIFYTELKALQQQFAGRLSIEFIFSNNPDLIKAHLHAEWIESLVQEFTNGEFSKSLFYLCGPEAYMRLCLFTLRSMQVPGEHIKKEIFHTRMSVQRILPPDHAPHEVTILMNNTEHKVTVHYPLTILQAAKKQNLILPYSCEAGRCGNCIAKCESGKIWMSYNEVITEKELAEGLILTCTGHPVDGNAVIRIA